MRQAITLYVLGLIGLLGCRQRDPGAADVATPAVCETATLISGGDSCAATTWLGDVDLFLRASDYQGALPRCRQDDFLDNIDVQLEVEGAKVRRSGDDPGYGHLDTVISAQRLGVGACGVALVATLKGRMVELPAGRRVRYLRKRVVRDFEADVSVSVAVRDERNGLLLGWASGHRSATWDGDVLPELVLRTTGEVCRLSATENALSLELTGDGSCSGQHAQESCCRMNGTGFVLRVMNASRTVGRDLVNLLVGRTDVLLPRAEP